MGARIILKIFPDDRLLPYILRLYPRRDNNPLHNLRIFPMKNGFPETLQRQGRLFVKQKCSRHYVAYEVVGGHVSCYRCDIEAKRGGDPSPSIDLSKPSGNIKLLREHAAKTSPGMET